MAWYIPIYKNDKGGLCCATGSDNAYHSNYVRRDKVRETIRAVAKRKFNDMEPVLVYSITDSQFWDVDIWNPYKVMNVGKREWRKPNEQ